MVTESKIICPGCEEMRTCSLLEQKQPYQIWRCAHCRISFSNPMKAGDSHYYETYTEYGDKWEFEYLTRRWVRENKTGNLLDIACGDGRFLKMLPNQLKTAGIDFNPSAIKTAREKHHLEVFHLTLSDFLRKFSEKKFQIVTAFHIIEHLEKPGNFLDEIKQCLTPDGILALSVPNPDRWRLAGIYETWDYPPHHLTRWNAEALKALLERHGFQVSDVETEMITTFKQVQSPLQDTIWGFVLNHLSFGTGSKLNTATSSYNPKDSQHVQKSQILSVYPLLVKLKILVIRFAIFLFALLFYPWLTLTKKQGKSLLILAKIKS